MERGRAFTFDIDIKDEKEFNTKEQEAEWKKPRNPAKMSGSRKIDVDAAIGIAGNQFEALWCDDDEIQSHECNAGFQLRWSPNSIRGMIST